MREDYQLTNVAANRRARKWSRKELAGRVLWGLLAQPLFALSPRPMWGFRRSLLRLFGARVGRDVHVYPTVRIAIPWNLSIGDGSAVGDRAVIYALGPVFIGERVTVSQYAHLCAGTHDWRDPAMPLVKRPIVIADDVWICADVFVGPGVTIGASAVVGARAVAMRDVPANAIVAGNPAKQVGERC